MDFLDRYKFDFKKDILGYGGFGEVYKAYDTLLNREVALKFFKSAGSSKYDLISEIKKVIRLHHSNLLEFYDATILSQQNAFGQYEDLQVGVMEYADQGDLLDFMKTNPTKKEIKIVLLGILSGLQFLHSSGFIHRDLKPQNILFVKKGQKLIPKIADFGISKNAISDDSSNSTKLIGTVEYMAPEQFSPKFAINSKPSYNMDLWALGVMLFELLSGTTPFGKRNDTTHSEQIMHNICYEGMPKKIDNIEEPFKTVLNKCLIKDANKRVKSADELIEFINNYRDKPGLKATKEVAPKTKTETFKEPTVKKPTNKGKFKLAGAIMTTLVILSILAIYLFNQKGEDQSSLKNGFRYYIDLSDKKEGVNALIYLDTALMYLDSSYSVLELSEDSSSNTLILDEVLLEIKDKKVKTAASLPNDEKELRALDVLSIESEFEGRIEIKRVWLDEVFKLNEKL